MISTYLSLPWTPSVTGLARIKSEAWQVTRRMGSVTRAPQATSQTVLRVRTAHRVHQDNIRITHLSPSATDAPPDGGAVLALSTQANVRGGVLSATFRYRVRRYARRVERVLSRIRQRAASACFVTVASSTMPSMRRAALSVNWSSIVMKGKQNANSAQQAT